MSEKTDHGLALQVINDRITLDSWCHTCLAEIILRHLLSDYLETCLTKIAICHLTSAGWKCWRGDYAFPFENVEILWTTRKSPYKALYFKAFRQQSCHVHVIQMETNSLSYRCPVNPYVENIIQWLFVVYMYKLHITDTRYLSSLSKIRRRNG